MYLNKVFLLGNLTKDPELRSLQSGSNVCNFSIATNKTYIDKGGQKQSSVEYHNVVAWGKTAELISQYMRKGSQILVDGRLQTSSYKAKDGSTRYKTEIVCENMQFGNKPRDTGNQQEPYRYGQNNSAPADQQTEAVAPDVYGTNPDEEVPF